MPHEVARRTFRVVEQLADVPFTYAQDAVRYWSEGRPAYGQRFGDLLGRRGLAPTPTGSGRAARRQPSPGVDFGNARKEITREVAPLLDERRNKPCGEKVPL